MNGEPIPRWWAQLAERASQPPQTARAALFLDGVVSPIGSIAPLLAERLRTDGLPIGPCAQGWVIGGEADAALARIARHLSTHGLAGAWRDERLAVTDADLQRRGVIERAAVRPLGIATFAVHLIGFTPAGHVWVQQRALDKATDPGRWDTLVGGLVAADEDDALARETWEEAGLRIAELGALAHADHLTIRRPVREGYMVEHIDVFEAVIPDGVEPRNQDGEVARFECMTPQELIERLAADAFTLEAGLMLAHCLARRGVPLA